MSRKRYIFIARLILFAVIDGLFSLFYFWSMQLSYGIKITGSSLTLPIAIAYGEFHWHGPAPLVLIGIGMLSPLLAFLPLTPLLPLLKKSPFWVKGCCSLLWLGEIVALGFFMPRLSFL